MNNNFLINGSNYEVPIIINITKVFLNNSETKKRKRKRYINIFNNSTI